MITNCSTLLITLMKSLAFKTSTVKLIIKVWWYRVDILHSFDFVKGFPAACLHLGRQWVFTGAEQSTLHLYKELFLTLNAWFITCKKILMVLCSSRWVLHQSKSLVWRAAVISKFAGEGLILSSIEAYDILFCFFYNSKKQRNRFFAFLRALFSEIVSIIRYIFQTMLQMEQFMDFTSISTSTTINGTFQTHLRKIQIFKRLLYCTTLNLSGLTTALKYWPCKVIVWRKLPLL